jgi:ferredoxin-NADP reductase
MHEIDNFLNSTTMYRLLIYYLGGLLGVAFVLSLFGNLGFSPVALAVSVAILVTACWAINRVLAFVFRAPVNHESSIITALILALIITPKLGQFDILFLLAAAGLAMASKYVLTIRDVHIFNPAAIAVVITAIGPRQDASWWVGTAAMLPFVLIGGLLVMRKIRREQMVLSFFAAAFVATLLIALHGQQDVATSLKHLALTSPLFFLGFVMLTEPLTSPGTMGKQTLYAVLVALLMLPQTHIGRFYTSPEIALILGNIFAYLIDPRARIFPVLVEKFRTASDSLDFVFNPGRQLAYQPGQYMEWTLPHGGIDDRGNRRYFTLASSPTEQTLRLGVKFYNPSSSYKLAMLDMTSDTPMVASQVAGDFVLPRSKKRKLAFIAGGIGVTPFRSMMKYLLDTNEQRDVRMLYAAKSADDIAYRDVFEQARQQLGTQTTYVLSQSDVTPDPYEVVGRIDTEMIARAIPDYRERMFYISGSHEMVVSVQDALSKLGVPRRHIKVDYFPGYM